MLNATRSYDFQVLATAERVFLADRAGDGLAAIFQMTQSEPGNWEAHLKLGPGEHRLRYYSGQNGAVTYLGPAEIAESQTDGWDAVVQVPAEMEHESDGVNQAGADRLVAPGPARGG